ncbi:outer membrane protein assembly factor BamC [Methylomagnum sp.]
MNRLDCRKALVLLGASVTLAGCDTISSWFPDKQKQYQYSTEIPPLEIPPDLSSSTIDGAKRGAAGSDRDSGLSREASEVRESPVAEAPENSPAESERPKRSAKSPKRSEAAPTLAQSSDDVPLIEIEVPFELAWVEVAKALGRMELEITDQNRSDGVYYVYYGGDRKPYEDRGFFGDIAEVFGAGQALSKEYRIKLEQKGTATSVYILDSDNKPQTSGPGFDLLKRLHETLQSASAPGAKPASEKTSP